jgi:hypothetical protein
MTLLEMVLNNLLGIAHMALKAAKYWVSDKENLVGIGSNEIIGDNFTQEECDWIHHLISTGQVCTLISNMGKAHSTFTIEKFLEFKAEQSRWKNAKQQLFAHLNIMKNKEGIPYGYMICDNTEMTDVQIQALLEGTKKMDVDCPTDGGQIQL